MVKCCCSVCVRSGGRWVHCGPCRPCLSLSSVWESEASKFLRMPLVKVALLYSFLTVDKSNEKTRDHSRPCISPIISAFWPFPVCGTQQQQQWQRTHTVRWYTWSGVLLLCVTYIEWKWVPCLYLCWWLCSSAACLAPGTEEAAVWGFDGHCWGFCFLYVRCVRNEKSSAVSHVIKGIIRRAFLSVFLCTFISLCIIFFPELWFWI